MPPKKPSELIREGCLIVANYIGYAARDSQDVFCGCALGTGAIAMIGSPEASYDQAIILSGEGTLVFAEAFGAVIGLPPEISAEEELAGGLIDPKDWAREGLILDVTQAICEVMEAKNVDKVGLSELLGTSKANVTQLLTGSRNMTLRTLADICLALGVKPVIKLEER